MRKYQVLINDVPHTLLLDDEAAANYGDRATLIESKAAPAPKNKARSASAKSEK